MVNFDREQMRRIANNMPEQHDDKPQVEQVAKVINNVFSQLMAAFPATTANRSRAEMNEIRRQWVLAFRENDITTMEQVAAGMRVARRQERPFLPSPASSSHGVRLNWQLLPGFLMPMNWSIWFTSIAARVVYTRMQNHIHGNPKPITGLSPHCTQTCELTLLVIPSCAARQSKNSTTWLP